MEKNTALIFAGLNVSDEEKFRVGQEIAKLGGLTFSKLHKSEEGWYTQCDQIEGLIAGNSVSNPTPSEIENEIRQAILAAFNVKVENPPQESPFQFNYSFTSDSN